VSRKAACQYRRHRISAESAQFISAEVSGRRVAAIRHAESRHDNAELASFERPPCRRFRDGGLASFPVNGSGFASGERTRIGNAHLQVPTRRPDTSEQLPGYPIYQCPVIRRAPEQSTDRAPGHPCRDPRRSLRAASSLRRAGRCGARPRRPRPDGSPSWRRNADVHNWGIDPPCSKQQGFSRGPA
jgi:hypothetical protein